MVRPMLSDHCLSVFSVTWVYGGQTVGWINMKLGIQVDLGPGHFVLDGDPAPLPQRGAEPPIFGPSVRGQMAAGIKMPLGMEVGLSLGDFMLDVMGTQPLPKKGVETLPSSRPMSVVGKRREG